MDSFLGLNTTTDGPTEKLWTPSLAQKKEDT